MAGKVKAVPEGMHTITPHLVVGEASKAIEFYKKAFGAQVKGVHQMPDGKVAHAEIVIGDSKVFMSDEFPEMGSKGPQTLGGTAVVLNVYVENVDELFSQAVASGATVVMPLANQFWGDRYGLLEDPFGHRWALAAHVEDVAPDEMERRSKAAFAQMAGKANA
ncbi:MAG: VOC family protein [Terriglobia bacterium]